jgi:hypothetical protein
MHWSRGFVRYAPGWLHLTAGKCRCLFGLVSNYKSLGSYRVIIFVEGKGEAVVGLRTRPA